MQRWNINYLKELYNKYYKLSLETDDPTLSLEYDNTANSIFNIIDRYDELVTKRIKLNGSLERVNFRRVIEDDFSILDNYGIFCPYVRRLDELGECLEVRPNSELPKITVSTHKILTVSRSFYDSIGGIFASKYVEMAKRFKDTLHIRKLPQKVVTNGQTYSVCNTDITFVELGVNQTTQDYVSAIHEFGHGISCAINPMAMYDYGKYCFIELDSLFFEMVGLDFLSSNLSLEKDSFDINIQVLKDYIYSAQLICSKLDMYDSLSPDQLYEKRNVKNYLFNEIGYNKLGANDVMNTYIRDYLHYIISYLTAIELYMIYQSDKSLALDLLHKIIITKQEFPIGYLNFVKSLGLEPGNSFNDYLEILIKQRI